MIVDASAIVAVLRRESDAGRIEQALADADRPSMSAANYVEAAIVLDRSPERVDSTRLDRMLGLYEIEIAPVTESQARIARQAYRDFGKGSGHRAQLNFGDCFAYALATDTGEPLLYKGDDFAHAGVRSAL